MENSGAIYVGARSDLGQAQVVQSVRAFWNAHGAFEIDVDPLSLYPRALDKRYIAYAISPAINEWIGLFDSEVYEASPALAHYLARELDTEVLWVLANDPEDQHIIHCFRGKDSEEVVLHIQEGRILEPPSVQSDDSSLVAKLLWDRGVRILFARFNDFCANPVNFYPAQQGDQDRDKFLDSYIVLGFRNVTRSTYVRKLPRVYRGYI